MLSGIIAGYVDYLVRAPKEESPKNALASFGDMTIGKWGRKFIQSGLQRVIPLVAFPIFVGADVIVDTVCGIHHKIWSFISCDEASRKSHVLKSQQCWEEAEKCILGWVASPLGVISPDLVTRHFVPPKNRDGVIVAGGKLHKAKGREVQPDTKDNLMQLVKDALANNKKIVVSGAHYSQSKDTLPVAEDSLCLNMRKLNKVVIDPKTKTAKVQAGATWADVQRAANVHSLAVKVMQASNVFSVGGSIGVNCHGWDHIAGSLGNTIKSLTVINAKGVKEVLTPKDELFRLIVGGHGMFGIVVEAELELADNDALTCKGVKVDPKDYVDHFKKNVLPNKNVQMELYRLSLDPNNLLKEGISVTYETAKNQPKIPPTLTDEPDRGTRFNRILIHLVRTFPNLFAGKYWRDESKRLLTTEETLTRNEIMRPDIKAAFNNSGADAEWLQEYFVPGKELAPFLDKLSKVLTDNKVPLFNASVRYVKRDMVSELPYTKDEDMFAVVLFFNQSLAKKDVEKAGKWVREIIDYLNDHNGTYYLPYEHFATPEQFAKSYHNYQEIIRLKKKYDKKEVFDNGLYNDYIRKLKPSKKVKKIKTNKIKN